MNQGLGLGRDSHQDLDPQAIQLHDGIGHAPALPSLDGEGKGQYSQQGAQQGQSDASHGSPFTAGPGRVPGGAVQIAGARAAIGGNDTSCARHC